MVPEIRVHPFKQWYQPDNPETEREVPLVMSENRKRCVKDYILWVTYISVRQQLKAFESGSYMIIGHTTIGN